MDFKNFSSRYFMKQKMMRTVLIAMVPVYIFAVYQFGLRVLALLLLNVILACISELTVMRMINGDKAKISEAAYVSAGLYTLTLPPTIPFWISGVGIIFGIVIGKCVFGGFAKNIFNPALVARCFIYVCFPVQMTVEWFEPIRNTAFGGFARWTAAPDAISAVTPMINMKQHGIETPIMNLFLGNISGSIGETSALIIIIAGIYLLYTKTANWKVMTSTFISGLIAAAVIYYAVPGSNPPLFAVLSGGFLFGTVFMATDPITHPQKDGARIVFGIMIGVITMVLRRFSLFTEGMMFAVLIANSFSPLIDRNFKEMERIRKERQAAKLNPEVKEVV